MSCAHNFLDLLMLRNCLGKLLWSGLAVVWTHWMFSNCHYCHYD